MKKITLIFFLIVNANFLTSQTQIGQNLNGDTAGDLFGENVSISGDGNVIAIASIYNDSSFDDAGLVRVFTKNGDDLQQLGNDIKGSDSYQYLGSSISLNNDGSIIVIGGSGYNSDRQYSGFARVFRFENGNWVQIGDEINGSQNGDNTGMAVSISSNGNIIAVSSDRNDTANGTDSGLVRIYENQSDSWVQIGNDIIGSIEDIRIGNAISLNSDGNIIAIASSRNDVNNTFKGEVKVFQNDNGSWIQMGSNIIGQDQADLFGHSIDLSSDGKILAISAIQNRSDDKFNSGQVKLFEFKDNNWIQLGNEINGDESRDKSGESISLNGDGTIVAISSVLNDSNGTDSGYVRLYKYNSDTWLRLNEDLFGENTGDNFGSSVSLSSDGAALVVGSMKSDVNGSDSGKAKVYHLDFSNIDTESPSITSSNSINIDENSGLDQLIYTVTANDNIGIVTYKISGDNSNYLEIDENNGEVTLKVNPDFETHPIFNFNAIVYDRAGNSDIMPVILEINDLSENISFEQIDNDIDGINEFDEFGKLVKISGDGQTLVGSSFGTGEDNMDDCEYVRVYSLIDNEWKQKGNDIRFQCSFGFGRALSINNDGSIIAVGINNMPQGQPALAKIYNFQNGDWVQLGGDIQGDEVSDGFTNSISLNDIGNRLAIGVPYAKKEGVILGKIKIYEFTNTDWQQLGDTILGEDEKEYFGISVDFDSSGSKVIVGAIEKENNSSTGGQAKVYQFDGTNWNQLGQDIKGELSGGATRFGYAVSMNSDGSVVAISAPYDDDNGGSSGHVRVFEFNNSLWEQQREDIDGDFTGDLSGWANGISLSDDGKTLAIGAHANDGNGSASGQVRVFKYNSENWNQFGEDIYGEAKGDYFGRTLSLSGDGSILIVGGQRNDSNGDNAGHIRVFNISNVLSTEENNLIRLSKNNMTLFPNPVSEKVSVKISTGDIKNIEIFNLLGQRVVSQKNVNTATVTIDAKYLKKGMYVLRLIDDTTKMQTKKFIKN